MAEATAAPAPAPTVNPDTVRTFVAIAQSGVEVFDFEDPETHFVFTVKAQTEEQREEHRTAKERRKLEAGRLLLRGEATAVADGASSPRKLELATPVQTVPGMREHPKAGKIYGGGMKTVAAKYPQSEDVVAQQHREREEIRRKLGGGSAKAKASDALWATMGTPADQKSKP
jgi:hypothetical protein